MAIGASRRRLAAGATLAVLCLTTPAASLADHGGGQGNSQGTPAGFHGNGDPTTGTVVTVPAAATPVPVPATVSAPASGSGYHGAGDNASQAAATPAAAVAAGTVAISHAVGNSSNGNGNGNGNGNSGNGNGNNGNGNGNGNHGAASHGRGQAATTSVTAAPPAAASTAVPATPAAPAVSAAPAAAPTTTPAATPAPAPSAPASSTRRRGSTRAGARRGSQSSAAARRAASRLARSGAAPASHTLHGGSAATRTTGPTGLSLTAHRLVTASGGSGATSAAPRSAAGGRRVSRRRGRVASTPLTRLGTALGSVPTIVGHLVPLPVPDWSKPIIAALAAICLLLALRVAVSGRRARRLERQRAQLTADLALMQAALIPEIPSAVGGLAISAAYRPADGPGAGGDFYDAFALDETRVAIVLGDVSGHGRGALSRAAQMHYTLRAYMEMGLDPRSALKLAGRVQREEESDLFTTVVIAVHDAASGTLTYASAGHPAPIVAGPDAADALRGSASPPLGWGVATGRRQTTIPFAGGTQACFFTDGATEARSERGLLGREELTDIVTELGDELSAAGLLTEVRRRARAVRDDMAACVITAGTGAPGHAPRIEELEVDERQLAAGQGDRFLHACGVAAGEAALALAQARTLAADSGAALLRVVLGVDQVTATAARPASLTLEATARSTPALSGVTA